MIFLAIFYLENDLIKFFYLLDKDECSVNNGGCSHQCINTDGSFVCGCPKGFTISANKSTCQGKLNFFL